MKKTCVVLAMGMMTTVGACTSGGAKPDNAKTATECTYPDDPKEAAPLWVCDAPVDGVAVSAVGSAPKQAAGTDFQKEMAEADARTRLAREFRTRVSAQVAKAVRLKFAPELHFQPDTALDYAMRIDQALKRPEVARDLGPTSGQLGS